MSEIIGTSQNVSILNFRNGQMKNKYANACEWKTGEVAPAYTASEFEMDAFSPRFFPPLGSARQQTAGEISQWITNISFPPEGISWVWSWNSCSEALVLCSGSEGGCGKLPVGQGNLTMYVFVCLSKEARKIDR